jgi:Signal peptidase, peptidase S26
MRASWRLLRRELVEGGSHVGPEMLTARPQLGAGPITPNPRTQRVEALCRHAQVAMGDNRPGSQDSRWIGPADDDDLVGRAFVVFWPSSHWQWL